MNNNSFIERYLTPIAVVIGALILALAYVYGHGALTGNTGGAATGAGQAQAVDIKDVKTDGDPYVGDPSAPVTMALWFDYQCPFCKEFDTTVLPQLYTNYIQTGKLKVVFKDFQFLGPDSTTIAEYARAVWELYPDQFYAWYEALFNGQGTENTGWATLDAINAITAKVPGIDTGKVVALMNEKKSDYDAAIAADRSEGASFGINGTPSMIIGTTLLTGAEPYDTVSGLIDQQLGQ